MEDYRRLVSYIYTYVNGEKSKNVGFAKIEVRGNELRMRLSVRVNEESSSLVVYGYSFRRGEYGLHILGEMPVEQGFCNATFQKFRAELSVDFQELKGLYICPKENAFEKNIKKIQKNMTENIIYGSEWTDIPIEVEDFRQLLAADSMPQCACEREMECESEMIDISKECMCEGEPKMCEPPEEQMRERKPGMCEPPEERMREGEPKMCEPSEEQMRERKPEMCEPTEECAGEFDQESDCDDSICEAANTGNMVATAFTKLGTLYPKVHINELDGECIQITPHDIKFLPRRFWQLENNSFLLHGYYNYRHIIIWKREMGGEVQYILGVPGLFHPREQTIAHMFGFPAFEGNRRGRGINFGYWCVRLD